MQSFERKLLSKIIPQLNDREFIIIIGARQTGKSTLLKQIAGYLNVQNHQTFEITLEDLSILAKLDEHPENLFLYLPKPVDGEIKYVLIDEIQYLKNPTNFLKLLYDKYAGNLKIIATGSSAFYIDTRFKDSLAGRKQIFELHTLSFDEFLYFKTGNHRLEAELVEIRRNEAYLSAHRQEMITLFDEYLTFGGYPAVVLARTLEKKSAILKELLYSFTKRDMDESNIQQPEKFYRLMMILAEQTGNLMNVNELSVTLGLSTTSINNYLYILQKCFHIGLLKPYFRKLRKELTKMPKVYFNDLGLRNILLNLFQPVAQRPDKSALIENYLYKRLNELNDEEHLRYWRTASGHEVDFVVLINSHEGMAIECKFQQSAFKPSKYKMFTQTYPEISLRCLSFDNHNNRNWILAF